jgi:hypothetical protein
MSLLQMFAARRSKFVACRMRESLALSIIESITPRRSTSQVYIQAAFDRGLRGLWLLGLSLSLFCHQTNTCTVHVYMYVWFMNPVQALSGATHSSSTKCLYQTSFVCCTSMALAELTCTCRAVHRLSSNTSLPQAIKCNPIKGPTQWRQLRRSENNTNKKTTTNNLCAPRESHAARCTSTDTAASHAKRSGRSISSHSRKLNDHGWIRLTDWRAVLCDDQGRPPTPIPLTPLPIFSSPPPTHAPRG